jgi:hypothetical protein
MGPTLAGFQAFLLNTVGISTTVLPPGSQVVTDAYNNAIDVVLCAIQQVSAIQYTNAVYYLGTSYVLNWAPDLGSPPTVYKNDLPFFAYTRKQYNLDGYVSGTITAASDEATSETMVVPDQAQRFTLGDISLAKDPYGRAYLAIAQKYGDQGPWGLS